jgi:hypothetical protein
MERPLEPKWHYLGDIVTVSHFLLAIDHRIPDLKTRPTGKFRLLSKIPNTLWS